MMSRSMQSFMKAAVLPLLALPAAAYPGLTGSARQDDTLLLLLVRGPLGVTPLAEPQPRLASLESIVNPDLVAPVTIQTGLQERLLRADSATRARSSIVDWPADSMLARHYHAATERLWMLDGRMTGPSGPVEAGEFWEARAGVAMGPFTTDTGAQFIFFGEGDFNTVYLTGNERAPRAGGPETVDPASLPWQTLSSVVRDSRAKGSVKTVRRPTSDERGVYLVRLDAAGSSTAALLSAVDIVVLRGSLVLSDPYHGTHRIPQGFYLHLPAGFPSTLFE